MGSGAPADRPLTGTWRATEADEELRRAFPEPAFDDGGWPVVAVPGLWHASDTLGSTNGPVLYRHEFEAGGPGAGRRSWMVFDGLCYQADIWLDGRYLGDTEGYFAAHRFEVTEVLEARTEHVLGVELACSAANEASARRNVTGAFQPPEGGRPNPGGIWAPVRLTETGPVAIRGLRALCTEAAEQSATVTLRATLDAEQGVTVLIRTTLAGVDVVEEHVLAAGLNERTWQVVVDQPALWWPHALGDPVVHELVVTVVAGAEDSVSDERSMGMGLRQVRMKHSIATINGERLFLKGATVDPPVNGPRSDGADELERKVLQAREVGFDVLRVRGHVAEAALYDAADRHGVLLWQDLPLQGGYSHGIRKQAGAQAVAAVEMLGHHPSIALWCAHDDPPEIMSGGAIMRLLERQLPSWNRTVLDASVRRAFEKADGTRPTIAHAEPLPECDLDALAAQVPRAVEFPIGVGAADADAGVVRRRMESLRRLKYRPTGGLCITDEPDASLVAACAPVIVVADEPDASYQVGAEIELDIHVVSDLRTPLTDARVEARILWASGSQEWSWSGDIDADSCSLVGRVRTNVPVVPGPFTIELDLVHHGAKASNRYSSEVVRASTAK